ncbi:MAG: TlpA disulfide reductase family protein [Bacteroidota bacterium]
MSVKKEIRDWGIFFTILGVLYFTGLYTDVAAFAQNMVLKTGLITPDTRLAAEDIKDADYNLTLKSLDGEIVKLEEYKGKVIFMNLWASWCAPCVAEMPSIEKLYEKVDKEKVAFVMLSMDKDESKAKRFVDRKKFDLPFFLPASGVPRAYYSPSIPTTYVISKDGKIVSKKVGMANYDTNKFLKFIQKEAGS